MVVEGSHVPPTKFDWSAALSEDSETDTDDSAPETDTNESAPASSNGHDGREDDLESDDDDLRSSGGWGTALSNLARLKQRSPTRWQPPRGTLGRLLLR